MIRVKLLSSVLVVAALGGCGGGGGPSSGSPEGTVSAFLEAGKSGAAGRERGYSFFTEKVRTFLEDMRKRFGEAGSKKTFFSDRDKVVSYTIKNTEFKGESALVTAEIVNAAGRKNIRCFRLKKEKGYWKIYGLGDKENVADLEKQADLVTKQLDAFGKAGKKAAESKPEKKRTESSNTPAPPPVPVPPEIPEEARKQMEALMKNMGTPGTAPNPPPVPPEAGEAMKKILEQMKKQAPPSDSSGK